jgi:hypothetical protein
MFEEQHEAQQFYIRTSKAMGPSGTCKHGLPPYWLEWQSHFQPMCTSRRHHSWACMSTAAAGGDDDSTSRLHATPKPCPSPVRQLANDTAKAVITQLLQAPVARRAPVALATGTKVFAKQEGSDKPATAAEGGAGTGTAIEAQFYVVLSEGLPVVLLYVDESAIVEGDMRMLRSNSELWRVSRGGRLTLGSSKAPCCCS